MALKIYDTLSQVIKDFKPLTDNVVHMYVCGPTVYDYSHLGHARCYITWDVVYRYLTFCGHQVRYIRNVTDIDDKIIKRAKELNVTAEDVANINTIEFHYDMASLNILAPTYEPKATDHILEIQDMIQQLIENSFAYESGGDIYFSPVHYQNYCDLSKQKKEDLIANSRVDHNSLKKDQTDFVLWKSVTATDFPHWDSPWGLGRPGWHIECNAMIHKHLGNSIDIHAGGCDLVFPHHENERALAESCYGPTFVHYWMHNGFVTIDEEKMSKSLGNFKTIRELMKQYSSDAIRYFILTNHYRMPVNFSHEALTSASKGIYNLINSLDRFTYLLEAIKKNNSDFKEDFFDFKNKVDTFLSGDIYHHTFVSGVLTKIIEPIERFKGFMDQDFNTSGAMSVLFDIGSKLKNTDEPVEIYQYGSLLKKLGYILGLRLEKTALPVTDSSDSTKTLQVVMDILINLRSRARSSQDWETSDYIRSKLADHSILLKDSKDGVTTWSMS